MRTTSMALAGLTATLLACGAPSPDEPHASAATSIINGTDSGESQDATVMLTQDGRFSCTGTLVMPNLVLTARHCVTNIDEEATSCAGALKDDLSPNSLAIVLGADAPERESEPSANVVRIFTTKNDLCSDDIALVELDHDIAEVAPAALRFSPVEVGESTIAVGYGMDEDQNDETDRRERQGVQILALGPAKYQYQTQDGQSLDADIEAGTFLSGESTCFGDSGGPLFDAQGRVVGVTSSGIDEDCIDRPSIWTSIATHEDFIRSAAEHAGHPLPRGKQP